MPRDLPVGNGQMLVCFDQTYQIRDFYFPQVGQENHAGEGPCRFGVWATVPQTHRTAGDRRKHRLAWLGDGWERDLRYEPDTLATDVRLKHPLLHVTMRCSDVVDFHRPLLLRRIEVTNDTDETRPIRLFHHQNFDLFGNSVGETAYFDPQLQALVHYRNKRYVMATFIREGRVGVTQYATGTAGFGGAEGTYRDAEDGQLGGNSIAQGSVDSTMMMELILGPRETGSVYMLLSGTRSREALQDMLEFIEREGGPENVMERTRAYWRLWLHATSLNFPSHSQGGPSRCVVDLYKRSLLVVRTQIDNSGAIIAANDSDIMNFAPDTYSYLWPRDGALVAAAMDAAGYPTVGRSFFQLCKQLITEGGYFLHKYNPDGSPASSWHPWVANGAPQLPIQEDETALVIWALWKHYERYRDIEFVRPLWLDLVVKAADFMVRFRDPATKLPLPSYDLWEERYGVHTFTVASVYGGLLAASRFATCFGDKRRADAYALAAQEVRDAACRHLWSEDHKRFLRRINPKDTQRTSALLAQVLAGQTPADATPVAAEAVAHEADPILDASLWSVFAFGMLSPQDERVTRTMRAIEKRLWIKTPVGGVARYEGDYYHAVTDDKKAVPGNPWFICTLWLADWHIAKARTREELSEALPIFEWVANHALPSGVLAEQVHPLTNAPLSVSPLTWSHATVVAALVAYREKLETMTACPTCHQSRPAAGSGGSEPDRVSLPAA